MTRAEQIAADADEAVSQWPSLSHDERVELSRQITPLASGGAIVALNGVDQFLPSWRDALDELTAHRLMAARSS